MKSTIFAVLTLVALVSTAPGPLIARAPPNIPTSSEAQTQLAGLTVAAQGSQTGYSRDLFPHWNTISGTCNTRETVLKRDGTSVVTDSACVSTSGRWYSPYDGATWYAASDVDIDHVVPLSNAWKVCRSPPVTQFHSWHECSLEQQAGQPAAARPLPMTWRTRNSSLWRTTLIRLKVIRGPKVGSQ